MLERGSKSLNHCIGWPSGLPCNEGGSLIGTWKCQLGELQSVDLCKCLISPSPKKGRFVICTIVLLISRPEKTKAMFKLGALNLPICTALCLAKFTTLEPFDVRQALTTLLSS